MFRTEIEDVAARAAVADVVRRPDALGGQRVAENVVPDGLDDGRVVQRAEGAGRVGVGDIAGAREGSCGVGVGAEGCAAGVGDRHDTFAS